MKTDRLESNNHPLHPDQLRDTSEGRFASVVDGYGPEEKSVIMKIAKDAFSFQACSAFRAMAAAFKRLPERKTLEKILNRIDPDGKGLCGDIEPDAGEFIRACLCLVYGIPTTPQELPGLVSICKVYGKNIDETAQTVWSELDKTTTGQVLLDALFVKKLTTREGGKLTGTSHVAYHKHRELLRKHVKSFLLSRTLTESRFPAYSI